MLAYCLLALLALGVTGDHHDHDHDHHDHDHHDHDHHDHDHHDHDHHDHDHHDHDHHDHDHHDHDHHDHDHHDHDHHDHGDHPRLTCDVITPLAEVNYTDLSGNWVAVESMIFNDGHPFAPQVDKRFKTCMHFKDSDIIDSGMTVKIDYHYPGEELTTENVTVTKVGETEKGRLTFRSDLIDYENWEFLIMDTEPTKYMVYALCQPPNEAGERLPYFVNLLSRHADHEVITNDEELQIERKIGEILKLEGFGVKPVKFSHDCWASYAEPQ